MEKNAANETDVSHRFFFMLFVLFMVPQFQSVDDGVGVPLMVAR